MTSNDNNQPIYSIVKHSVTRPCLKSAVPLSKKIISMFFGSLQFIKKVYVKKVLSYVVGLPLPHKMILVFYSVLNKKIMMHIWGYLLNKFVYFCSKALINTC